MLRSIFSLIHNIIDSDREYKNTYNTSFFLCNLDNNYNVDMEINGKDKESSKMMRKYQEEPETSKSFNETTDQGDAVSHKHDKDDIQSRPSRKISKNEKKIEYLEEVEDTAGDKVTFLNEEEYKEETFAEIQGDAGLNVRELLARLPQKRIAPEKDKEQLGALLEQIQKMKKGMERLHKIAKQFTCSDKLKQDVDYLIKSFSVDKGQSQQKNLDSKKP